MLTQLALLPMLATTITGVTSQTRDDGLTIEVATSEPMAAGHVRPMAGHRLVYLFLDGASPEQETFPNGGRTVVARERQRYTKLEIPMALGQRCYEPAQVQATPSGLTVQFACSKSGGTAAAAMLQENPDPAIRQKPQPAKQARSEEMLKAALALPAEMPFAKMDDEQGDPAPSEAAEAKPIAVEKSAAPKAQAQTAALTPRAPPAPVAAPAAAPAEPARKSEPVAQTHPSPAAAPVAPAAPTVSAPAPSAPGPVLAGATSGNSWFALGGFLLVGVVGGMLALSRRRTRRAGLIHILETAAIGPKRTLLVARVNGRTMVLGASEAGIALLESIEGKESAPVAQVMGEPPPVREKPEETVAPGAEAPGEPEGEVGVLQRLFRRRARPASAEDEQALKLVSDEDEAAFQELLNESLEDQKLRERLSQGLVAKVS